MVLAWLIEIGNQKIKVAATDGSEILSVERYEHASAGQIPKRAKDANCEHLVVASVVPGVLQEIVDAARSVGVSVTAFRRDFPAPIVVLCAEPSKVGDDRLLNAFAAQQMFGGPVVVVDAGTAVTVDVVTARGEFAGGLIALGPVPSCDALHERAALLPAIRFEEPADDIGRNTVDAMRAGQFWMIVGGVREMIRAAKRVTGDSARVVATGGDMPLIARRIEEIDEYDPQLTLKGLLLAWRASRERA